MQVSFRPPPQDWKVLPELLSINERFAVALALVFCCSTYANVSDGLGLARKELRQFPHSLHLIRPNRWRSAG